MASNQPPQQADENTVRLSDLLASATYNTVVEVDLPDEGALYVRNWRGYIALRVNRHRAFCWHRRLPKFHVSNIAERGIEAGGSVRTGDVENLLPRRYHELPERLAPEDDG